MNLMKKRKLTLEVLQAAAREATQSALMNYPELAIVPTENLTLGTAWDGDVMIFELYIASNRP